MFIPHQEQRQETVGSWVSSGIGQLFNLLFGVLGALRRNASAAVIGIMIGGLSAAILFQTANLTAIITILILNTTFLCGLGAFLLLRHQRET